MSGAILSGTQLTALRKMANRGLTTPVTVVKRTYSDANPLSDDEVVESTTTIETMGWMYSPSPGSVRGLDGMTVLPNDFRLYLPVGTDVDHKDHVIVGDEEYVVNDVAREDTWPVFLRLYIKKYV